MNWGAANSAIGWRTLLVIAVLGLIGGGLLPSDSVNHPVAHAVSMLFLLAASLISLIALIRLVFALFDSPARGRTPRESRPHR